MLSKELIGADCKHVELKVIAVTEGKLPSEIAHREYVIREDLDPKPVTFDQEHQQIKPHVGILPNQSGDPADLHEYDKVFNANVGASVNESPSISDGGDMFFGD